MLFTAGLSFKTRFTNLLKRDNDQLRFTKHIAHLVSAFIPHADLNVILNVIYEYVVRIFMNLLSMSPTYLDRKDRIRMVL